MPPVARRTALAVALAAGLAGTVHAAAPTDRPWMDRSLPADRRAELIVAAMTDDEKFRLIRSDFGLASDKHGVPEGAVSGAGYVPALPRLGLAAINETDAGLGVNKPGIDGKGAISLPAGLATAASFDPAVAHAGGRMIGGEARGKGYAVLLSGGVNLVRDPRNGRNFEYAGEDPILAGTIVGAAVKGIQERKILATVKHFAINDLETGRNTHSADIDPVALRESDLLAFQIAIAHGDPASVMSAYNRINGVYAGENAWLLTDVLKKEWGFKGFVMSDWGGVHSGAKAAMAGLDQESAGEVFDKEVYVDKPLRAAVASGEVPKARLDDMVRRIMRSLFAHGVIDEPTPVKPTVAVPYAADRVVARDALEAGAVLLRNEGALLPLARKGQSVVVIGAHADKGVLAGGGSSTVTDEGGDPVPGLEPTGWPGPVRYHASAPLTYMQKLGGKVTFDPGTDPAAAAKAAAAADVAVVFVTKWAAESYDAPDMSLPDGQDALVAAVAKANRKVVVVLETNGAVKMPWLGDVGAVMQAWYPGSGGGEGIARLLYGETSPSGRLPVSWPKDEAQLPRPTIQAAGLNAKDKPADDIDYNIEGADVGYRWFEKTKRDPLFAFGYGLTYTTFAYSDFAVGTDAAGHPVAHVTVKNTGRVAGADVPQIYVAAPGGAMRRLAGWSKVSLKPGASRRVDIPLEPMALARYDDAGKRWRVAPGTYKVKLARSATDFAGEATLEMKESFPVVKAP
ncbi:beta-glucosidase [Luteibacter sp. UNCMF331Sha3.1]|uniref:glycoside hydrolase family 3 C-terminal domain-containing protein n=1 Tax=Luteibacter sp. UNCMF331Sha3.1 TaxID=1502760 RepID=UPI0008C268D6|nr:glycoside hydrolase family 3 C-terminal domain-containing protein [Luteibacter sp. UNCMF331Sha3.1]SEM58095.1 beta-glucosidase [Luteibacter sp. UNCMF331Sha3.1]